MQYFRSLFGVMFVNLITGEISRIICWWDMEAFSKCEEMWSWAGKLKVYEGNVMFDKILRTYKLNFRGEMWLVWRNVKFKKTLGTIWRIWGIEWMNFYLSKYRVYRSTIIITAMVPSNFSWCGLGQDPCTSVCHRQIICKYYLWQRSKLW